MFYWIVINNNCIFIIYENVVKVAIGIEYLLSLNILLKIVQISISKAALDEMPLPLKISDSQ